MAFLLVCQYVWRKAGVGCLVVQCVWKETGGQMGRKPMYGRMESGGQMAVSCTDSMSALFSVSIFLINVGVVYNLVCLSPLFSSTTGRIRWTRRLDGKVGL